MSINKHFAQLFAAIVLLALCGSRASAGIIDFVKLTEEPGALGESAWNTLSIAGIGYNLNITATKAGSAAHPYLDWNHAGLGVCGVAFSVGSYPDSTTNRCNPGSDDNVTDEEMLTFMFDADVYIEKIWFNNTHDPDHTIHLASGGDLINIGGGSIGAVGNGYATGNDYNNMIASASANNYLGGFSVNAGTAFNIGFVNEQFYISGMEVSAVPEPGMLPLLGLGMIGIGFSRRRRQL